MSNYYSKKDAKVRLCEELSNRGWKIFGYKENESDSMTDYYSPANWNGIATKNGYTIVIDDKYGSNSNKDITKYNKDYKYMTNADTNKIEALKNMTTEKGATEGEENNAKSLIEKLEAKYENQTTAQYQIVDTYPTYMGNSKGSIWHIEKDGSLIDKGNSLTIFADVPSSYMFDIATMEYKESYKECRSYNYELGQEEWTKRTLTEAELKAIKALKAFILRVERAVTGMNTCGDGTTETEKAGLEQQENETMEKVIIKKVKNVIKPVKADRTEIQENDVLSFNYHGHYWMVTNIYENAKNQKCVVYEILGSASRGYQRTKNGKRYYQTETKLMKEMAEGTTVLYTLQEVEEITEKETWVKVKTKKSATKKTNKETQTTKEEIKTETKIKETVNNEINTEYTIIEDVHTKTNEKLYVVKFVDTFSKEDFKTILFNIKSIGGYYSSFKKGFIFKEEPTELLKSIGIVNQEIESEDTTDPYEHDKIEEGYLYSCHFKEWDITIETIKNELLTLGIKENNIIDYGNKIGIEKANYNLMKAIELINNKNGSILFIDSKVKIDLENKKVPA